MDSTDVDPDDSDQPKVEIVLACCAVCEQIKDRRVLTPI